MRLIPSAECDEWLAEAGIVSDSDYPYAAELIFAGVPADLWRAWETPRLACDLPHFVSTLMSAAAPTGPFVLRPRGDAPWYTGTEYGDGPLCEQIRDRIVGTLPIPADYVGAIEFGVGEWRDVQMLLVTFLVYGWCVADDLQVVAGDRSCVLMTSHHGYVSVRCRDAARLAAFQGEVVALGFPVAGDADLPRVDEAAD